MRVCWLLPVLLTLAAPALADRAPGDPRLVDRILDGTFGSGDHSVDWSPGPLAPGIYFVRLESDAGAQTLKTLRR